MSSLFAQLKLLACRYRDRVAYRDDRRELTFGEWMERAEQWADHFTKGGISKGSRLLFYCDDPLAMAIAYAACFRIGAVCVPVDPESSLDRVKELAEHCAASGFFISKGKQRAIQSLAAGHPIFVGDVEGIRSAAGILDTGTAAFFKEGGLEQPDFSDHAFIFYTSGSTGRPKGAIISHRSVLAFMKWGAAELAVCPEDAFFCYAPLHFDMSLMDLFVSVAGGAACVFPHPRLRTNPAYLRDAIHTGKVTVLHMVPSAMNLLLQAVGEERLEGLRMAIFAGEPFPVKLLPAIRASLPGARIINIYGSTETNDAFWHEVKPEEDISKPVPIGRPLAHVMPLVLNEEGKLCGEGETGELYISSATSMSGYVGVDPKETFVRVDGYEGWFYPTRDLVRVENGLYYFVGRKDNMIKLNGQRVNTGDVENVLLSHPAVREAVVITSEQEARLRLAAVIHVDDREGAPLSGLALRTYCAQRLPRAAIPTRFVLNDQPLPKTSTGKVDRQAVTRKWGRITASPIGMEELKQFLIARFLPGEHVESLPDDYDLIENGVIDSLGIVGIVVFLEERLGVEINEAEISLEEFRSVTRMMRFLQRKGWWAYEVHHQCGDLPEK
ncbi:MAG: AMP-binding protein [Brevibacillus sp.]|nr:AMP-binding protein [Brevibacillus sp.]